MRALYHRAGCANIGTIGNGVLSSIWLAINAVYPVLIFVHLSDTLYVRALPPGAECAHIMKMKNGIPYRHIPHTCGRLHDSKFRAFK